MVAGRFGWEAMLGIPRGSAFAGDPRGVGGWHAGALAGSSCKPVGEHITQDERWLSKSAMSRAFVSRIAISPKP